MRSSTQRLRPDSPATNPTTQEIASILADGILRQFAEQQNDQMRAIHTLIQRSDPQPAFTEPTSHSHAPEAG